MMYNNSSREVCSTSTCIRIHYSSEINSYGNLIQFSYSINENIHWVLMFRDYVLQSRVIDVSFYSCSTTYRDSLYQ